MTTIKVIHLSPSSTNPQMMASSSSLLSLSFVVGGRSLCVSQGRGGGFLSKQAIADGANWHTIFFLLSLL